MVKKAGKTRDSGKSVHSPRSKIGGKQDGPLNKCFNSRLRGKGPPSPRSSATSPARSTAASSIGDQPSVARKTLTGGFLMYIKSAIKSQNPHASEQARAVHDSYQSMSLEQKRALVDGFFKSGGKRSGLQSTYQQCLTMKHKSEDLAWEGYLTVGTLMTLWGVC